MNSNDKLAFLSSTRFWALLLASVFTTLGSEGYITPGVLEGIQMLLAGFVGIRSVDRFAEQFKKQEINGEI